MSWSVTLQFNGAIDQGKPLLFLLYPCESLLLKHGQFSLKRYWYDGEFFWDYWDFTGAYDGRLIVGYHRGTEWWGDGWTCKLQDAEIEIFTGQEPESSEIEPVATWFIERDLNKPELGFRTIP